MSGNTQPQDQGQDQNQDPRQERDTNMEDNDANIEDSSIPAMPLGTPPQQIATEICSSLAVPTGKRTLLRAELDQASQQTGFVVIPAKRTFGFDDNQVSLDSGSHKRTQATYNTLLRAEDHTKRAAEKIQDARQNLIEAAALLSGKKAEQSRVLNLIEVFRDYIERQTTPTTANILATQTNALEKTIQKLNQATTSQSNTRSNTSTQSGAKASATTSPIASRPTETIPRRPTFAEAAKKNVPTPSNLYKTKADSEGWQQVERQRKSNSTETKPVRLVLELKEKDKPIQPLQLRDNINKLAKRLGFQGILALSTTRSGKGNLVVQLANKGARDFARQFETELKQAIGFLRILEDDSCFKVAIHGISTQDFDKDNGLSLIRDEIETYNTGLKPIGDPIWLTNRTKRQDQQGASILVTFQTEEEARRAVRYRLFIGGMSVRAEMAKDKAKPATQGGQC
jgi:hypothetical protein